MADIIDFPAGIQGGVSARVRTMSTERLKELWDQMGTEEAEANGHQIDGIWIEELHIELNRRGEGEYCIV